MGVNFMIAKESIENLKSSIDIVDLIGNFIELKKMGANYKAPCPFHNEKTPSFVVSPVKQIYHCFGCGIGGDGITFVMELEKLSYPEAIEKIASIYNFTLEYTNEKKEKLPLLEPILKWFLFNFTYNIEARNYLLKRGVSNSSIEKFELGYAPSSQAFIDFLQKNIIPMPKALDMGVLAKGDRGYYARFIERIIFPIYSNNNSLVGFAGRTISNHPAKYINSPQTQIFNKSQLLYAYNISKPYIFKEKRVIVCEGYLDVILLHQAGFNTAVASMGTALTKEHLPLLRKGEPEIILAYDGDNAGIEAGFKASKMLSIQNFKGGIVLFPKGKDPAELIANDEIQIVANLLRKPKPFATFILEHIAFSHNLHNIDEKEKAFSLIKEYLAKLTPFTREAYLPLAGSLLAIPTTLFGQNKISQNQREEVKEYKKDIVKLSILKTLNEKEEYLKEYKNFLDIRLFREYQIFIEDIKNHQIVRELSLDDTLELLDKETLHQRVINLIIYYFKLKLKEITTKRDLDFKEKSFLLWKIKKDILPRLQKKELVSLDEIS